ncbi:MAG: pantoate--beta-alanine ligase, partial [Lentisphaeraceae bacterium]|nr:pantoate--beta-alanine ligase [Lentisphaeraceae bacterium]
LSPEERKSALNINESMKLAIKMIRSGESIESALSLISTRISASGGKVDYIKLVDSASLDELSEKSDREMRLLVAAVYGPARLIDNMAV